MQNSESLENKIRDVCEKIFNMYGENFVKEAFSILIKLFNNILSKPQEEKFRIFKKSNEVIKKKILVMKENLILLKEIGYVDLDNDIMTFQGNDLTPIKIAADVLNSYIDLINSRIAEKEHLEKLKQEEERKRLNEEVQQKLHEKKLLERKIQEQLENDRRERAQREKPKDSMGKDLSFGAKVCKFEPKKGGEGRG